jgi:hypothetical protein
LRLPLRLNGAGLIGVDSICAAAFVGSVVASCETDEVLSRNIGGLERFARPARLLLQARLAPLGATKTNELLKLPHSELDLFDRSSEHASLVRPRGVSSSSTKAATPSSKRAKCCAVMEGGTTCAR